MFYKSKKVRKDEEKQTQHKCRCRKVEKTMKNVSKQRPKAAKTKISEAETVATNYQRSHDVNIDWEREDIRFSVEY